MQRLPRKSGVRWRAYWRDPSGKIHGKVFVRKRDAERYGRDQEFARDSGAYLDPSRGKMSVETFVEQEILSSSHRAQKTLSSYRGLWESHIAPALLGRRLGSVTKADVRRMLAEMESNGTGAATRASALRLTRTIFSNAVDDERIARTPATGVRGPKVTKRPPRFLSDEEVLCVMQCAPDRFRAMILLMAYTGLRIGETVALRVEDLELLRRRVTVSRAASDVDGRRVEKGTKTGKVRAIMMPRFVSDSVATHMRRFTDPLNSRALVFTASQGGAVLHGNFRKRVFYPACASAGINPTPRVQDLRHTAAALAIRRGAGPKQIQEMLGLSSIVVTMDVYGHLFDVLHEELADRHDEAIRSFLQGQNGTGDL